MKMIIGSSLLYLTEIEAQDRSVGLDFIVLPAIRPFEACDTIEITVWSYHSDVNRYVLLKLCRSTI